MFERTQNYRTRLDQTKKSLEDFRNILNNKAIQQQNNFIKPIFNGYNTLISIHECVRRGLKPITQSLQMTNYSPDFAEFIVKAMPKDLENAAHLIGTLYYEGSHLLVRPDELAFLQHFKPDEFRNGRCLCGECRRFEDNFVSTTARIISSFTPPRQSREAESRGDFLQAVFEPQSRAEPQLRMLPSETTRLRSNSFDSTDELLDEMENQVDVSNSDSVAAQNIFYQRENASFIVRLPAQSYNNAQHSWPHGFVDVQISDSLFSDLDLYFIGDDQLAEQADEGFLDPVAVVMSSMCYPKCVTIAYENEGNDCPICLQTMCSDSTSIDLDELCVSTKCCGKIFHDKCLRHQLMNVGPPKCPLCRTDLRFDDEIVDFTASSSDSDSAEISEIFQ